MRYFVHIANVHDDILFNKLVNFVELFKLPEMVAY